MKLPLLALFFGAMVSATAAAPLVIGFERFHRDEPSWQGGRLLFHELGCANCHQPRTVRESDQPWNLHPERSGPLLRSLQGRLDPGWVAAFLADPGEARAGSAMPHLLAPKEVDDVLHYLYSLGSEDPKTKAPYRLPRQVNAERGSARYHEVGCVACHEPTADYVPATGVPDPSRATYPSVAFPDLDAKYDLTSLSAFLADPVGHRPDGRMPKIELEPEDYAHLAAHLLDFQDSNPKSGRRAGKLDVEPDRIASGKTAVTAHRCAACHSDLPQPEPPPTLSIVRESDGGCLAVAPGKGLPRYPLDPAQRASLKIYLDLRQDQQIPSSAFARHFQESLNCFACHADTEGRGGGGPDSYRSSWFTGIPEMGEAGLLPPPLTEIGWKLREHWLAEVLRGEHRLRPYLHVRMPVYGRATEPLAALLGHAHSRRQVQPPQHEPEPEIGRKLLGTVEGAGCITCHSWGDRASLGIPAINLANVGQRLNRDWFRQYVLDPPSYRPNTLMPAMWPEEKSSWPRLLQGDSRRQIDAIYDFAMQGEGEPEGYPSLNTGAFELVPTDKPVVLRTFMKAAGAHAVLVGFPEGIHFAYDTLEARPRIAWKGRFFDAYSTWFVRAAPFEEPLGEDLVAWPREAPGERTGLRFKGYRLGTEDRIPTFLLELDGTAIEERIVPIEGGLRRVFTGENVDALNHAHPKDVRVTENSDPTTGTLTIDYQW